jgi:membrane associated rhomboid family serine protease
VNSNGGAGARKYLRTSSPIIPIFIFINVLVFLLWNISTRNLEFLQFMADNFLVSWSGLQEGRYWTLITSVFSHHTFLHLLANMFVLYSFGPIIERALGLGRFLKFYFGAGILSSLCHALVSAFILAQPELPALGASGAISGLVLLFSLTFPKHYIYFFGLIPVPALLGALAFIGLDIWGLIAQAEGGGLPIGHGAHLGGALYGIVYFMIIRYRYSKAKPSRP